MAEEEYDMIIIGGGASGLSGAIYSTRFKMKTLVIAKELHGLLALTHLVENWPGEISISGLDLMKKLEAHAKHFGAEIKSDEQVVDAKKEGDTFKIKTDKGEYTSKVILLATGTDRRKLGAKGEEEYRNKGVSYCATCDGPLFSGKVVAIVGGSDSAAKESLLLSEYCKKVYIIYRGEKIHPEPINMDRVMEKVKGGKIEIINNTNVAEVHGDGKFMTGVKLDKPYNGKGTFPIQGLFIEIGHLPKNNIAKKLGVELDEKGYVKINRMAETSVPGVYSAGDIVDDKFAKQAITGAGEAVVAAINAFDYIEEQKVTKK